MKDQIWPQLPDLLVKNNCVVLQISMASPFSLSLHHQHIYCFPKWPRHLPTPYFRNNFLKFDSHRTTTVPFAVTESDSPKSLEPDPLNLLQQLADSFVLPADYFSQLPRDLRLDLNDAAFDLSNGPVKDECGEEVGETLLNISRAWEQADASTSTALVDKLLLLVGSLTSSQKSVSIWKALVISRKKVPIHGTIW
ncbi:hypothetical protein RND71_014364 [Anisodus tanguticus]|uniref:Uncharacterized protein n=1 Tax=Anisodus tanguticus TaxID=243964 RepID=A0AAE1SBG5_9SOLA|nr:hypothetical protein RND71_014364 [Anisodus tanguticus]